jgi:hypothetical protein
MTSKHPNRFILFPVLVMCLHSSTLLAGDAAGGDTDWTLGGHTKLQYVDTTIPGNSVLQELGGDDLPAGNLEIRLKLSARRGHWEFDAHGQLISVQSEALGGLSSLPGLFYPGADVINDKRRWFDLTHPLHASDHNATLVRFDRASVAYTDANMVLRFGRQAISWGNGLLFTPMDIFNPFDPTAIDKEYKSGDDMFYAQYLLANGDDVQAVAVVRRNPLNGKVEQDQSSFAVKYHAIRSRGEFDLMASRHYGQAVLGLGASSDLGGSIWRGDLVWNDTQTGSALTAVAGVTASWVAAGHNWTGLFEYFYNGFGLSGGRYSLAELAADPELLARLARGELFNIGRHYLGVSVTLEVTPLLDFTPNIFVNLADPSAYAQFVTSYDWKQDLQLLAALSFPIGPNGSEYGGMDAVQPGMYVSTGPALFAQLAWYF